MEKNVIGKGILSAMGIVALASCAQDRNVNDLPNIIIMYTDDLGYGDLSCQNPESKINTPNLDLMASQGIRFTDGHSSCAVSSPSRYAILTGNYHWRSGGVMRVAAPFAGPLFDRNELTMADMLREKGYYTAAVGKWHLGWDWNSVLKEGAEMVKSGNGWGNYYDLDMIDWNKPLKGGPCDCGFDYYFGSDCTYHPPYANIENETFVEIPTDIFLHGQLEMKEGDSEMRNGPIAEGWDLYEQFPLLTDKVVDLILNKKKGQPLFIYYAMPAPHAPIAPNDVYDGSSEAGAYGDYVVEIDTEVGKIMKALEKAGIEDNTILVFSSDNGPERYACARMEKYSHNSSTFRGIKRDIYEGGHRVPFLIRWPEVIQPGTVSDEVVSQVDLMATFASLVGYELPEDKAVDSYNIMPVLEGDILSEPLREATVFCGVSRKMAIRMGDWVFIDRFSGSFSPKHISSLPSYKKYFNPVEYDPEKNPGLLFNLREDPGQLNNVYDQYPDVVEKLKRTLERYQETGRSRPADNANE